ncbi:MAG TPA: bifunctional demethylmenaquinone methyltransferase/2-methoxy-6-polyprenyl-1,4-benzoquinol methylase UbiE [Pirellulales bacterium]|jgi:demethylmenaquinone methyltransferase/2-methoxy-6-polyprenyl-1,4-benzoquinol methylase|nr:bifunctional demethylmenaquinone methyltransferase/2-methoxy-6-polyprenyl-1,4-benzoquinol methylase UbiE [Pirellulales bacterium]
MAVDKSSQRVRRMFGDIAARYDLLNHLLSLNLDRYWRWRTVRDVPAHGEAPILDLCTGTGDLALAYHRATQGRAPIVAADFCHPMLVVGRQKTARAGINGAVRFVEADTQRLPLDSDQFQIVSVAFGLRNVSDTDAGLAEMVRVCRPGGRVAVLEFSRPRGLLGTLYQWYFKYLLPAIGRRLSSSRDEAYDYLPQSVGEFPCGEALAQRMRAAGLVDVSIRPMTLGVATLYVGTKAGSAA